MSCCQLCYTFYLDKSLNSVMIKYIYTQICQQLRNHQLICYSTDIDFLIVYFSRGFQCGFKNLLVMWFETA